MCKSKSSLLGVGGPRGKHARTVEDTISRRLKYI